MALNGRPGVSESTRQRIFAIARQVGWSPNTAARALSAARSGVIGLVLARPARMLGLEPFYMEFISGVETILADTSTALLLKVVPDPGTETEMDIYRSWWTARRVDGVIVTDVRVGDNRLPILSELGLPAVILGSDAGAGAGGITTVWTDDDTLMGSALRYLFGLGHRRLARVAGPHSLAHCASRTESFLRLAAEFGMPTPRVVQADFSGEDGARVTRQLLLEADPPTAVMYENDIMAVAAIGAAGEVGCAVPRDVSVLAWDDSPLCSLTHPAVSAMHRDIPGLGRQVARLLLDRIEGAEPTSTVSAAGELFPRGSTAPPVGAGRPA